MQFRRSRCSPPSKNKQQQQTEAGKSNGCSKSKLATCNSGMCSVGGASVCGRGRVCLSLTEQSQLGDSFLLLAVCNEEFLILQQGQFGCSMWHVDGDGIGVNVRGRLHKETGRLAERERERCGSGDRVRFEQNVSLCRRRCC